MTAGEEVLASPDIPEAGDYQVDVTAFVQGQMAADKQVSLHITGHSGNEAYIKMASGEHNQAAYLVVETKAGSNDQPEEEEGPVVIGQRYPVKQDSYIDGGKPTNNYGGMNTMIIKTVAKDKYRRQSLIELDWQAYDKETVEKAVFHFYNRKAVEPTMLSLVPLTGDWQEGTVNWENKPSLNEGQSLGQVEVSEIGWYEIDLTSYLQGHLADQKLSFALEDQAEKGTYISLATKEDVEGKEPFLALLEPYPLEKDHGLLATYVDSQMENQTLVAKERLHVSHKAGRSQAAYLKTEDLTVPASTRSAFLRFYVMKDYHQQPVSLKLYQITNQWQAPELTYANQPSLADKQLIYTAKITNQGWYTVDVTQFVTGQTTPAFYLAMEEEQEEDLEIAGPVSGSGPVLYFTEEEDDFDRLRKAWAKKKNGQLAISDPAVKRIIDNIDARADEYYQKMNKDVNRTYLFEDLSDTSVKKLPASMRSSYVRLDTLLSAYYTPGSKYEGNSELYNDILSGLSFLYENWYNEAAEEVGNWWLWEIGVPKVLGGIIATVYDDLTPTERMNYLNAIYRFQPDPTRSDYFKNGAPQRPVQPSVGANRVDTCIAGNLLGALTKNPHLVEASRDGLADVYQYVTKRDGFYRDGSFVQHGDVAYTTAYGIVLVSGLIQMRDKLHPTRWQIQDPNYNRVYEWIDNAFIPLVFDGQAFPITAGRSLSRQIKGEELGRSAADGYIIARLLYAAAGNAPTALKDKWLGLAKRYMEKNDFYDILGHARNLAMIEEYQHLVESGQVPMAESYKKSHVFANMDRLVHHAGGYAAALAMYSRRIQNYEVMNGENLKGWYQGDGTLYLLNGDAGHYDNGYWPTVNPYRLPGTTVDTMERLAVDGKEEANMPSDFIGGVSLQERLSVAGMDLKGHRNSLSAKKSWFFMDDEIIALGAGIHSDEARTVETIVENRMLNEAGDNQLTVNGQAGVQTVGETTQLAATTWLHLAGSQPNGQIGYYFPSQPTIMALREQRTGSWQDINKKGSSQMITRNYLTLWYDHGSAPVAEDYAYAILPQKTVDQMATYASQPDFTVVSNTTEVQAIYEKEQNVLAANVFTTGNHQIQNVQVDQACSLMVGRQNDRLTFAVADPTRLANQPMVVTYDGPAIETIKLDPAVELISLAPKLSFKVNLKDRQGAGVEVSFKVETTPDDDNNNNNGNNDNNNDNGNDNGNGNDNNNGNSGNNNQTQVPTNDEPLTEIIKKARIEQEKAINKAIKDESRQEQYQQLLDQLAEPSQRQALVDLATNKVSVGQFVKKIGQQGFRKLVILTGQQFADVTPDVDYADALCLSSLLGVVKGYPNQQFGADKAITEKEYVTFLVRLVAPQLEQGKEDWFAPYRQEALALNLLDANLEEDLTTKLTAERLLTMTLAWVKKADNLDEKVQKVERPQLTNQLAEATSQSSELNRGQILRFLMDLLMDKPAA